jgi:hypothetical protein
VLVALAECLLLVKCPLSKLKANNTLEAPARRMLVSNGCNEASNHGVTFPLADGLFRTPHNRGQ